MAGRFETPIRRAQLITPFGVGAMLTNQDGVSLICASLDYWFREIDGRVIDEGEFIVDEWRLKEELDVNHFRLPPDFRTRGDENRYIKIPAFRFPQWHFCPRCNKMRELPLSTGGQVICTHCENEGKKVEMYQVRFVAVCDQGHISDFPWREWVHRSSSPSCNGTLIMDAKGGASLSSIFVHCEACGKRRSLGGITNADGEGNTELSKHLQQEGDYLCPGTKPWAGSGIANPCDRPIRGSLRNASNVYFAEIRSSLYLPRSNDEDIEELLELLSTDRFSTARSLRKDASLSDDRTAALIRDLAGMEVREYEDQDLVRTIDIIVNGHQPPGDGDSDTVGSDSPETAYRRDEFNILREPHDSERLMIRDQSFESYELTVARYFTRIMLVDRLRETRALTGFTRIDPGGGPDDKRPLLWDNPSPRRSPDDWLPVSVVHGEGIFLEFNERLLQTWEKRQDVRDRFATLDHNFQHSKHYDPNILIGPRFVLIHTFAHLLMNQLVYECGYSTAALRERLYISVDKDAPMAGMLMYTAAGDSDGTMGGLVRTGKPSNLEPVIQNAILEASWCSADPVCMEAAERGGQGPDSCNLAGCHNCALVPETSCENFNRFLDRGFVVGFGADRDSGYFTELSV